MTTIKVTMRNNADAAKCSIARDMNTTVSAKHNGGKVVILTVALCDVDAAAAELEAHRDVTEYEVR